VVLLQDIYSSEDISYFRLKFRDAWSRVEPSLPTLLWRRREYKNKNAPSFAIGRALYEGKVVAEFCGSEVVDMGNGRYDFSYMLKEDEELLSKVMSPPLLQHILDQELKFGYSAYVGALPVLPSKTLPHDSNLSGSCSASECTGNSTGQAPPDATGAGYWHRDAYSLFEDEAIDLSLPGFYYTLVIPLGDIRSGQGATEFVLGSHKVNFSSMGITTAPAIKAWAELRGAPQSDNDTKLTDILSDSDATADGLGLNSDSSGIYTAECGVGTAYLFHGFTLHRGGANISDDAYSQSSDCEGVHPDAGNHRRDALYVVIKKNWYSDEDPCDYTETPI
jgi:hypothetical protein